MSKVAKFRIESGIRMPALRRRSRFGSIRFSQMRVGDSVLLETCSSGAGCHKIYKRTYSSIYKLLRTSRPEGRFKVGMVESENDPPKIEIRLWKIE